MSLRFPSIIEYQPYNICNANCTYCPVGSLNRLNKTKGASLDIKIFELLIKQTEGRKLERISPHLNCEPLLCKELPDQIRIWKKHHPEAIVDLSTNGVFLTVEKFKDLHEAGLDVLEFHFMGVNKNYHEKAMQTKYLKVRDNIEKVLKFKMENNIKMTTYIFAHRLKGASLNDWHKFATEWKKKGADIFLGPLWNRAGWYKEEFDTKRKGMLKTNDPHPCAKPWQQIAVEHDGEVVLCSLDYKHQVKIGNINDNTIEEIWNNEIMRKYQDGQNNKEKLCDLDLCKDCIRGGRYILDEHKLTKVITANPSNPVSKVAYKAYLGALDIF